MRDRLLLLVSIITLLSWLEQTQAQSQYEKYDYKAILALFQTLEKDHSAYFRLKYLDESAAANSDVGLIDCSENEKESTLPPLACRFFYGEMADFLNLGESSLDKLPQVLFTGGMDGRGSLGANIVSQLAVYLLDNKGSKKISSFLRTRRVLLYPIPNPSGLVKKKQGEVTSDRNQEIFIQDDFPDQNTVDTLEEDILSHKSVSAKAFSRLLNTHMIVSAVVFETAQDVSNIGSSLIEYPDGDQTREAMENHLQQQQHAARIVAEYLQKNSPANPLLEVEEYQVKPFDSTAPAFFKYTNSKSRRSSERSIVFRSMISSQGDVPVRQYGDVESLSFPLSPKYQSGHISRNIQLALELIELSAPTIHASVSLHANHAVYIDWVVKGCLSLQSSSLYYRSVSRLSENEKERKEGGEESLVATTAYKLAEKYQNPTDELARDRNSFSYSLKFTEETQLQVKITAECDLAWMASARKPPLLVSLHANSTFYVSSTDGKYSLAAEDFLTFVSNTLLTYQYTPADFSTKEYDSRHEATLSFWRTILVMIFILLLCAMTFLTYPWCRRKFQQLKQEKEFNNKRQQYYQQQQSQSLGGHNEDSSRDVIDQKKKVLDFQGYQFNHKQSSSYSASSSIRP